MFEYLDAGWVKLLQVGGGVFRLVVKLIGISVICNFFG